MNGKKIASRAALAAVGGTLVMAAGPAPATVAPLGSVTTNTTVTLTGQTRASLAVVAAASASGRADVKVLGARANVLASGNAKVAADAQLTAAYSLKAATGTVVAVTATPGPMVASPWRCRPTVRPRVPSRPRSPPAA